MGARSRVQNYISHMSRHFPPNLARVMLLLCAAIWGGSYTAAKVALVIVPPQWLMFLRLAGACLLMLALFHRYILPFLTRKIIVPALVIGVTYYGTMALQTSGLQTIDPGRSAFLTAAYCVLTPFVVWIVAKQKPRAVNMVAGIICMGGVGFIALKPDAGSLSLSPGDWQTLIATLVFSFNLTWLSVYAKRFNGIVLTFVQFAVAGVLFLIAALFTEPLPDAAWLRADVITSFIYLFIFATMLAQVMQNIGLAYVPASSASIIMCTESLFSLAFSAIFWGEQIGWTSITGFSLIFVAVLMSVIEPRSVIIRKQSEGEASAKPLGDR